MALQYLAGQRLTADALQRAVPDRVTQGSDQSVTSSIALVDTDIVITVDGLLKIDMEIRWQSGGGGIRWDWNTSGAVTLNYRATHAPGGASTGNPTDLSSMYLRVFTSLSGDVSIADFAASSDQRGIESLVVDGSGTLTFRFAQQASNAGATILHDDSYALITRLGS